jgi:RNA polymerase sigma factor (TIGR02999 family)
VSDAGEQEVTGLLRAWSGGNRDAAQKLIPIVYDELRGLAAQRLRGERPDHTLRPTALVHEAYQRLVGQREIVWKNRAQFFALAAQAMRRVLVDYARARGAGKRGGGWDRITLDEAVAQEKPREVDMVLLESALHDLAELDPDKARMVELRFFGGLSLQETADALDVSPSTITREWRLARAWLYRRMKGGGRGGGRARHAT